MEFTGEMNQEIRNFLSGYCEKNGWDSTNEGLWEVLEGSKTIYKETIDNRRWYDVIFRVVEVGGRKIGFHDYHSTGDHDNDEIQRDISFVCDVEEVQVTAYKPRGV